MRKIDKTFHSDQVTNQKTYQLASGYIPVNEGGREVYDEVTCKVENHSIILQFPIYKWIDHYPNCDGEHDRWDTVKIGENLLTFDYLSSSIL